MIGRRQLTCPLCDRRGVTLRYYKGKVGGDAWQCRFSYLGCDFIAYDAGEEPADRWGRQQLAAANPTAGVWVSSLDTPIPGPPHQKRT